MLILPVYFTFCNKYAAICRNKKYLGSHYGLDIGYIRTQWDCL